MAGTRILAVDDMKGNQEIRKSGNQEISIRAADNFVAITSGKNAGTWAC